MPDLERADSQPTETGDSQLPPGPLQDETAPRLADGPDDALAQGGLEARVCQLEAELAAEQDRRLRALAELQNFRRRSAEERVQQLQFANEELLSDLVPVIDHFGMATEAADATDETRAVCRGYELILNQLEAVTARHGMTVVEAEPGTAFNPLVHDAVERVETSLVPEGTIVRVIRRGYALHGRILRPVQVAVAVSPA